jgi:hypothetical protein
LPERSAGLIQLKIDVNRSFRPNDHDVNGDETEVAIKLLGIKWMLAT